MGGTEQVHTYAIELRWTGNTGSGTSGYALYSRDHEFLAAGKPPIAGSSDPVFCGDAARWNPEELLVASLAACHQLWYLHLCADAGITVIAYRDRPEGEMEETASGGGRFTRVVLHPEVTLAPGADRERARHLHEEARRKCFIANSMDFGVTHEAVIHY
ncbi:MAG: OsmC family protein [Terriglobales bacterium]